MHIEHVLIRDTNPWKEVFMAVVGYCVKCKGKKEMVNPQEGVTKNNRIITKGTCPDCGTKMSLIGGLKK